MDSTITSAMRTLFLPYESESLPQTGALKSPATFSAEKRSEASAISMPLPYVKYSLAKVSVPLCPRTYMNAAAISNAVGPYVFRFEILILLFSCRTFLADAGSGFMENHSTAARTNPGNAMKIMVGLHVKFCANNPAANGPTNEPMAPPVWWSPRVWPRLVGYVSASKGMPFG